MVVSTAGAARESVKYIYYKDEQFDEVVDTKLRSDANKYSTSEVEHREKPMRKSRPTHSTEETIFSY